MSDLISRQAAIDAVQGIGRLATLPDNDDVVRMSAVEYVLFNLPSAQPEQRWIPCSERLPEYSGRYLVSVLDGIDRRTTVAPYHPQSRTWSLTGRMAYWKVVAWCELPEPWRGEEHGTDI